MIKDEWLTRHLHVVDWIYQAREYILEALQEPLELSQKTSNRDIVTQVDKQVEAFFINNIRSHYPTHRILGEEGGGDALTSLEGDVWIIDPIDGTLNFAYKQRGFGLMISFYQDGVGQLGYIYDVLNDRLYYGINGQGAYCNGQRLLAPKQASIQESFFHVNGTTLMNAPFWLRNVVDHSLGTRTIGSAALETIAVLTGECAAYASLQLAPWDVAAGKVILRELGLFCVTLEGDEIDLLQEKTTVLMGTQNAVEEVVSFYKSGE